MQSKYYDKNGKLVRFLVDGVERPISEGFGDRVHHIAEPIAKAIDKAVGTNLSDCSGCRKMRERLNAGMTLSEATKIRALEFIGRRLVKQKKSILEKVDARLRSIGK